MSGRTFLLLSRPTLICVHDAVRVRMASTAGFGPAPLQWLLSFTANLILQDPTRVPGCSVSAPLWPHLPYPHHKLCPPVMPSFALSLASQLFIYDDPCASDTHPSPVCSSPSPASSSAAFLKTQLLPEGLSPGLSSGPPPHFCLLGHQPPGDAMNGLLHQPSLPTALHSLVQMLHFMSSRPLAQNRCSINVC